MLSLAAPLAKQRLGALVRGIHDLVTATLGFVAGSDDALIDELQPEWSA